MVVTSVSATTLATTSAPTSRKARLEPAVLEQARAELRREADNAELPSAAVGFIPNRKDQSRQGWSFCVRSSKVMRSYALLVGLLSMAGCSSGVSNTQERPVASASVAEQGKKLEAKEARPSVQESPLERALGPDFQGRPELLRRFKDGLVTEDFVVGEGQAAQVGSRLTLRYAGILDNGVVFDENRSGPPFRFRLPKSPRVRGWGLGLVGMKAKGRRKITVPSSLGYGPSGDPGEQGAVPIPPNATLTYAVELLAVEAPPPEPKGPQAFSGPVLARKVHRSGLQIKDIRLGRGPEAKSGDRLAIHYRGYLPDGSTFDESVSPGAPFQFRLGDRMVIPGWNQGMVGMKPGGLRVLKVPAKLAYGKRGIQGVPPKADLVFYVELVGLQTPVGAKKRGKARPAKGI